MDQARFNLSDSQKLMVFLGGMDVIRHELEEIERVEKGKGDTESEEISGIEKTLEWADTNKKRIQELRARIVDILNKSGEVKDIRDLFKEPPSLVFFNPILFTLHLPVSLQKQAAFYKIPDQAEVEDFVVVYDGKFVMIAATCSLAERILGVYDARNRLVSMLKTMFSKFEITAPCLTSNAIVFVNKPEGFSKEPIDLYLPVGQRKSLIDVFRDLYLLLDPDIGFFYDACEIREEATDIAIKIHENQARLLSSLKEFLATRWTHPLKRKRIFGEIKSQAVYILDSLSEYSSNLTELSEIRSAIEEGEARSSLFKSLTEKFNLRHYTEPEKVDSESLIRIIEHARSETETYSSFVSTLISTFLGAVIGSALTILVSYVLRFL